MFPTEKVNDDPMVLSIPASSVPARMNSPLFSPPPWNIRENMLLTNYKTANLFHQTPEMNVKPPSPPQRFSCPSLFHSFRLFLLFIVIDWNKHEQTASKTQLIDCTTIKYQPSN